MVTGSGGRVLARLKAELLTALAGERLHEQLYRQLRAADGIASGPQRQEAQASLRQASTRVLAARQGLINVGLPVAIGDLRSLDEQQLAARIQFLGLPGDVFAGLDPGTTTSNLLPVVAPLDGGKVVERPIAGQGKDREPVRAPRTENDKTSASRMPV